MLQLSADRVGDRFGDGSVRQRYLGSVQYMFACFVILIKVSHEKIATVLFYPERRLGLLVYQ